MSPLVKLGNNPLSTFLLIICRTASKACKFVSTLRSNSAKYSDSFVVSKANLARLMVDTLTLPTLSAVPPIELKYPKSRISLFNLQQLLKLLTLSSTNKLLSLHFILCLIAHLAKSSSTNLPSCLRREIVETGNVNIFSLLISAIYSIYHF